MNKHQVYITDESGMASVFPEIKTTLTEAPLTYVTVLYHSHKDFIFCKEFNFLERHFPTRLYISYEHVKPNCSYLLNHEIIEAIINASTIQAISFIISGNAAFTDEAQATVEFLQAGPIIIQKQHFYGL